MKMKTLILKDVPRSVDLEINKAIVDYSVAICRVHDGDPATFTPLGSGTFVRRNGMHGILTAHHCLHACSPAVSIGAQGRDTLLLMVTRSRCVFVDSSDAKEHPLGTPHSDDSGPDLTFIEIFPGPKLDLLKAIVSFWTLDQKHYDLAKELSAPGIIIVEAGFPEIDYRTEIVESMIRHELKHIVFIGSLGDGDLTKEEKWDYIRSRCEYRPSETVPGTFKGVSGGGIWAVRLQVTKDDTWSVRRFCLIGVVFYETEISDRMRHLIGHFIDTIYRTAWDENGYQSG
jgi:hypothetical protein